MLLELFKIMGQTPFFYNQPYCIFELLESQNKCHLWNGQIILEWFLIYGQEAAFV